MDVATQARTNCATRLRATLNSEPAQGYGIGIFDVFQAGILERIGEWLPDFMRSMQVTLETDCRDVDDLERAVQDLVQLRDEVSAIPRKRPFLVPRAASCLIVDQALDMVRAYVDCLSGRTPLEVQRAGQQAQSHLDSMADTLAALNVWTNRAEAFTAQSTMAGTLGVLVADGMREFGASTLLELDHAGLAAATALVGAEVTEPGLGVAFTNGVAVASVSFDESRFKQVLREVFLLFEANPEVVSTLLSDLRFREDLVRLELELFDSAWVCQRVVAESTVPRQSARAIVDMHSTLVESSGRLVCSALLLASRVKTAPYEKLRLQNATELLRRAQQEPALHRLLEGLDDHLRTAQSHRAITYLDDRVLTDLGSGKKDIGLDTLVDQTLAAMESTLAALLAVRVAASTRGLAIGDPAPLEALGLSAEEVVAFMFEAIAGVSAEADRSGDVIRVRIERDSPEGLSGAVGGALTGLALDASMLIRLELADGRALTCPVAAYRRFAAATNEDEKSFALIKIQRSWLTDDGRPHMSDAVLRKWAAGQAMAASKLAFPDQMAALRRLRHFAETEEMGDVADMMRNIAKLARLQATEIPAGSRDLAFLEELKRWAGDDSPLELI